MNILDQVNFPEDLKTLNQEDLIVLCEDIRNFLIDNILENGGHFASNLGVVELTVALHRVLNLPVDDLIWDVGHQSYVHKILTGRKLLIPLIRKKGGISGYPDPKESEYDTIHAGHSSTSLSIAAGIVKAKILKGDTSATVAVIGDGAFTAGIVFEALNHIAHESLPVIAVLNDNGMSISENVGALSSYFTYLRTNKKYFNFKKKLASAIKHIPAIGNPVIKWLYKVKESIKEKFSHGRFFHDIGWDYLGPVDGHNLKELTRVFEWAKEQDHPILIHVVTVKGKGYAEAEQHPTRFHGLAGKIRESLSKESPKKSFSEVFGKKLGEMARENPKIMAITAAMKGGTGLSEFAECFPERFCDVGIAEQYAVDLAVGLALQGMIPVVAIYSTFLQRAYDMLVHDVGISGQHIVFCLDRAGVVPGDGPTHQGIFDIAYLKMIPGFTIMMPADGEELKMMLEVAVNDMTGPVAIRYPRDKVPKLPEYHAERFPISVGEGVRVFDGEDALVISTGVLLKEALKVRRMLVKENILIEILNLRFAKPISKSTMKMLNKDTKPVLILEEGIVSGGIGSYLKNLLISEKSERTVEIIGISDVFPETDTREALLSRFCLTSDKIAINIKAIVEKRKILSGIEEERGA